MYATKPALQEDAGKILWSEEKAEHGKKVQGTNKKLQNISSKEVKQRP